MSDRPGTRRRSRSMVVTGLDPLEILVVAVAAHSASRCGVTAGSVGPRDTAPGQIHRATRPRPSTHALGVDQPDGRRTAAGRARQRSPVEHSVGDLVDDGQGVPDALVGPLAEQTDVADGEDPRTGRSAASRPRSGPAARASSSSATQSPVNTTVSHSTRDPSASSTASTRARPTTRTTSAPRRSGHPKGAHAEREGREGVVSRLRRGHEDAEPGRSQRERSRVADVLGADDHGPADRRVPRRRPAAAAGRSSARRPVDRPARGGRCAVARGSPWPAPPPSR